MPLCDDSHDESTEDGNVGGACPAFLFWKVSTYENHSGCASPNSNNNN